MYENYFMRELFVHGGDDFLYNTPSFSFSSISGVVGTSTTHLGIPP